MAKRRWRDLSRRQQRTIVAAAVVQLCLLGVALVDLWHRPAAEVRGAKQVWAAAVFVNFVGPIAYFAFGRRQGGSAR
jgi:Phospholipase_D-nuclease N-terminal